MYIYIYIYKYMYTHIYIYIYIYIHVLRIVLCVHRYVCCNEGHIYKCCSYNEIQINESNNSLYNIFTFAEGSGEIWRARAVVETGARFASCFILTWIAPTCVPCNGFVLSNDDDAQL